MYALVLDEKAVEFLEKADESLKKRIWRKLVFAKKNPHCFFERLSGRKDYKLRIGDYRAIADISDKRKTIEITLIGHRKNIYKKLH